MEHTVDDGRNFCSIHLTIEFNGLNDGVSNFVNYVYCNGSTGCICRVGFSRGFVGLFRIRISEYVLLRVTANVGH